MPLPFVPALFFSKTSEHSNRPLSLTFIVIFWDKIPSDCLPFPTGPTKRGKAMYKLRFSYTCTCESFGIEKSWQILVSTGRKTRGKRTKEGGTNTRPVDNPGRKINRADCDTFSMKGILHARLEI